MNSKLKLTGILMIWLILIIVFIGVACRFTAMFTVFYNVIYGILLSIICPLIWNNYQKENIQALGIKPLRTRDVLIMLGFIIFSIGGQVININWLNVDFSLLKMGAIPLIMTTFFEEFLFRGFMQNQLEKQFNAIVAVVGSGMAFSLYHLGYPGFRTISDIVLLFAVGIMFSLAFKFSGNNTIVSYFVNLPNAFLTYILKYEQFPVFHLSNVIAAIFSYVVIATILIWYIKKNKQLSR